MKLVFVSHDSELTGATKSMLGLIRGLVKDGIDVLIILPEIGGFSEQLKLTNINFMLSGHRVNTSPLESMSWSKLKRLRLYKFKVQRFFTNILAAYKFKTKLRKKFTPDYVITNTSTTNFGGILSFFLGVNHIWYIREFGDLDHGFEQDFNSIFKILLQKAKQVIFISQDLENFYIEKYNITNTSINYNGVYDKSTLLDLHNSCDKPIDCVNFLFVGQLTKRKGIWKVINAFLKLKADYPAKLLIVGDGSEFNNIQLYINEHELEDKIELLGYQTHPDKFYRQAHSFIMASDREAFGRTTIEAVAYNCLVIANKQGATKEILSEHKEAIYFDGTEENLYSRMNYFLSLKEDKVQAINESAFVKVLDRFSQEANVLNFKTILNSWSSQ
ncbi:glycosyltransferase family 4 protein [Formosa sp. 3Alg 14/1]|uniref:glycosyltransferase family 4 protein n=1 Tax=Formosa sp. 3Alg 14/1 TaxID=3382190 RepID=UPI0039BDA9D1